MTNGTKHTPGPWIVDRGTTSQGDLFIHVADESVRGWTCVASVHGEIPEGAVGNARLIAAAPDLLAACEAIAALSDGQGQQNMLEVAGQARAALALARGERQ